MSQTVGRIDDLMLQSVVTSKVALVRLALGLLQGALLYFLYRAVTANTWPATEGQLFAPLLLASLLAPVLLISSLGHLDQRQAAAWLMVVVAVAGALGFYDIWRGGAGHGLWFNQSSGAQPRFPSALLIVFTGAGFYIAHALVLAGALDRRRIAGYPTYFETAWKLLIQITFSALFVGVLWLVLWLGAALFMLVQLNFLKDLLQRSWFAIPITAFAFACAMHITDVRPAIVRGIRTLLLVLLSWILPITLLIVAGFLSSLPWTGLAPLWATRHATTVLLGAAAVLIILINAAVQNGEMAADVAGVVRFSARAAACALPPIAVIAAYSLALRVREYGWTGDRIIAAACILVASAYALGYVWAAGRKSGWLAQVARVNVANAFLILAVLLALFSPIADPARLSVNDQMARFAAGKVGVAQFDFDYLKFDGARYGLAALAQLKARAQGADAALIRDKAELALKKGNRWTPLETASKPADIAANIRVWPPTAGLPPSFLREDWRDVVHKWALPLCLTQEKKACDAYLIDFDGDGKPEVLVVGSERYLGASLLMEGADGRWSAVGNLPSDLAGCEPLREKLQAGAFQVIAPRIKDLAIAGQRIEIQNRGALRSASCPDLRK